MTTTYPPTTAALVRALTQFLGVELTAHLGGGVSPRLVQKWAAGVEYPSARVIGRLHVAFELAITIGPGARGWFLTPLPGEDEGAPAHLLGWGGLNERRKELLHAARAAGHVASDEAQAMLDQPRVPRTVMLLDVDGVLIPREHISAIHTAGLTRFDFIQPPYTEPVELWFNPVVVATIKRWVREVPNLEINWCTSWVDAAPGLLAPTLGLPRFPVFTHPTQYDLYKGRPWKHLAIIDWVEDGLTPGTPVHVACVDDMALRGLSNQLRNSRSEGQLERSLVVEPKTSQGLTAANLLEVQAWLDRP